APGAHDPRPARAHVAAAPERSTGALAAPRSLGRATDRRGAAGGRRTAGHRQRWQPEQPGNLAHLADGDHRPLSRHPPIASSAAGVAHCTPYHSPSADCESCSEDAMNDWQEEINWNADGLVPAIAQDHQTGRILMMAWMNRESLRLSVEEGRAIYWSRSRGKLWRKGEESGHVQKLHELRLDCDADVLVLQVEQLGGIACHTGRESCFYRVYRDGAWHTVDPQLKN